MQSPVLDLTLTYASVLELQTACNEYAKSKGFKLIIRSTGRMVCERFSSPDHMTRPRTNGCDCKCQISYGKRADDGRVHFRLNSTCLTHTGHEVVVDQLRPPGFHIDSEKEVSEPMKVLVRKLVELDVPRGKIELELLKEFQIASINSVTFNSVMEAARSHIGYRSDGHEVAGLVEWLQNSENKLAHYQIGHDADLRCNKLFFMSQSMLLEFKRSGQVLIMDCTCKTNRFGWALFVCVGINQHLKTVLLSIALQKTEDITSYDWILDCMKNAVSEQSWKDIRMVMTDGDAALINSLSTRIPHAKQHRCRWHIGQNIRTNCHGELGKNYKEFMKKFKECEQAPTVFTFNSNWDALLLYLRPYPYQRAVHRRQHISDAGTMGSGVDKHMRLTRRPQHSTRGRSKRHHQKVLQRL